MVAALRPMQMPYSHLESLGAEAHLLVLGLSSDLATQHLRRRGSHGLIEPGGSRNQQGPRNS